jgi:cobaltochelatase CobS
MTPSLFGQAAEQLSATATEKPKGAPRGRPFQKGTDPRRLQEQCAGEIAPPRAASSSAAVSQPGLLDSIVAEIARQAAGDSLNEARVRELIAEAVDLDNLAAVARTAAREALSEFAPRRVEFKLSERPTVDLGAFVHPAAEQVLRLYAAGLRNIMLVGPAGCGKTEIAKTVGKALQLQLAALTLSGGTPEWHLTGRSIPNVSGGRSEYEPSASVTAYEAGGVILWDEFDAADPNMALVANTALSNGHWPLPMRPTAQVAERHESTLIVVACNTFGTGANRVYAGRNQLDAATLDRFACAIVEVDYDRTLERSLVEAYSDKATAQAVLARFWAVRDQVQSLALRRVVSMRATINAARLVKSGMPLEAVVKMFAAGWTADERSKCSLPSA